MSIEMRFWAKVNKQGPYSGLVAGRCHDWMGTKRNQDGYGRFSVDGQRVLAYRWLWEQKHGPVPDGLELDHLCKRPVCVRDNHLEPVTHRKNVLNGAGPTAQNAIKTHCPTGHRLAGDNLYIYPNGGRACRTCRRDRSRRYERTRIRIRRAA